MEMCLRISRPYWRSRYSQNVEEIVLHKDLHLLSLLSPFPLLVGDLVPPQPVLVVAGKAVDNNGYGQGEDEDAAEGAQAANQFAREGGGRQFPVPKK